MPTCIDAGELLVSNPLRRLFDSDSELNEFEEKCEVDRLYHVGKVRKCEKCIGKDCPYCGGLGKRELGKNDWLMSKVDLIEMGLPFYGRTGGWFANESGMEKWIEAMLRSLGEYSYHRIEELRQEVLYKIILTGHVEKFNPIITSWKHFIYTVVKTTRASYYARRSTRILAQAQSMGGSGIHTEDGEIAVGGKEVLLQAGHSFGGDLGLVEKPESGILVRERVWLF